MLLGRDLGVEMDFVLSSCAVLYLLANLLGKGGGTSVMVLASSVDWTNQAVSTNMGGDGNSSLP
jgi:hypothetical protein